MDFELDNSFGLSMRANPSFAPADLFRRIADLAAVAKGPDAGATGGRLSELLPQLRPELLAEAIKAETNITQRKRVLGNLSDVVSPDALLVVCKAAAHAYERPLSPVLAALLDKLCREANELPGTIRVLADHSYRDLFRNMLDAWSAHSVDSVSTGFDALFGDPQAAEPLLQAGSVTPEPERVLSLAFETGATGSLVWGAVAAVSETQDGVRRILDMLKRAPASSRAASTIAQQFANPVRLTTLLHEDPVDFEAVDTLLSHMGEGAAAALLDALAEAKSRTIRRGLLDRLGALGPNVGPLVITRLNSDDRWYVQRNMLTVLREAKCSLSGVALEKYTAHADARVRREATQLQFNDPAERDRALAAALRDTDVGMLKFGLRAARASMPESVVPILARRVVDPAFPPEFRAAALNLLARSNSMLALEALLRFAMGGTTLLGKPKLAPKSSEMLIALAGLARAWPNERRAAPLIALARESKDPEIARAAAAGAPPALDEKDVDDD
ncbi:MAG: hypothetical protein ACT443_04055 [Gemmatimonadota bacterium]